MTTLGRADAATVQRRTISTLVGSQALGGIGVSTGIAVTALLAEDILGSADLAGLAQTAQVLGAAAASYGIARITVARGRRPGLTAGYCVGALGAVLCLVAGVVESFPVLLAGSTLLGAATAANSQARFAATDLADPAHRARALSIVVWATTIGAVAGPNLVGPAGDLAELLSLPRLTGAYLLGAVGIGLGVLLVSTRMRPDPLVLARELERASGAAAHNVRRRAIDAVREHPRAAAGIVAVAAAHATMVSVMVMTPLHMGHGGAELEVIGFVISVHIVGMYAFSPVVGWLTDAIGARQVLLAGGALLFGAVALAGTAHEGWSLGLTAGLFLLGLGWSFALVAGSAVVTSAVPLADRPAVQGFSDMTMGIAAGGGGALAGVVVGVWGFATLNAGAAVIVCIVVAAALAVPRPDVDAP
ncbi:MFS transporter [Solicola gregarius]|uniref:MFS transporter n=1 Tax=Solicola gregarius TaxID=2908642 RepID=A0AA46YL58_9ACTN|nr:MFS transporter [Solicola gregarius]UYM04543.1 MFS transporter [Solicola gregarius]